jgi:hypothetical protein
MFLSKPYLSLIPFSSCISLITVSLAMPSTTSDISSQTPSVNDWQPINTTKQHLPWPIDRQAMSPPCCPPATSHLPPLAAHCLLLAACRLPLAAQCWCWPAPIAAQCLVSHPLLSVCCLLSKQYKVSIICLNCLNINVATPRQQLSNEGLLLFQGRWRLQW